mgnify:CR=1 FL=1
MAKTPLVAPSNLGGFTRWGVGSKTPDFLPNLYSGGREIGDEYRYILDRRYATKYPGNRLARPGLLLNPWDKRSTDSEALPVADGATPLASAGSMAGMAQMADMLSRSEMASARPALDSNWDFLAAASPAFFNLIRCRWQDSVAGERSRGRITHPSVCGRRDRCCVADGCPSREAHRPSRSAPEPCVGGIERLDGSPGCPRAGPRTNPDVVGGPE